LGVPLFYPQIIVGSSGLSSDSFPIKRRKMLTASCTV
jgi:hypothetical protein